MPNPPSQMTLEALRSVPLFASLDDDAARELRDLLLEKVVPQNTRLFDQGDTGDAMYLIESGRVRISIRDDDKQELTWRNWPRATSLVRCRSSMDDSAPRMRACWKTRASPFFRAPISSALCAQTRRCPRDAQRLDGSTATDG